MNLHGFNTVEELVEAQDRQIPELQAAEKKYKEDGDIESILQFYRILWRNGGVYVRGKFITRAAELMMKHEDYDEAWQLLNRIFVEYAEFPECKGDVNTLRYEIMKKEGRYMGSIEHLVCSYGRMSKYSLRDKFIEEAKKTIKKVDKQTDDVAGLAEELADIGEKCRLKTDYGLDFDDGKAHDEIKQLFQRIGWL